jgi:hypothetical protein
MPATTISTTGRSVLRLLALVLGHPRPAARLAAGHCRIVSFKGRTRSGGSFAFGWVGK